MRKINGLNTKVLPCLDAGVYRLQRAAVRALGTAVGVVAAMFGGTRDVQAAPPIYNNSYFMSDHMAQYGSGLASMYSGSGYGSSCSDTAYGYSGKIDRAVYNDQNSFTPSTACLAKLKEIGLCAERSGYTYVMDPCGVSWSSGSGSPLECTTGGAGGMGSGCTISLFSNSYSPPLNYVSECSGYHMFFNYQGCGYNLAFCQDAGSGNAYCRYSTQYYSSASCSYLNGMTEQVYPGSGATLSCPAGSGLCTQEFEDYFNCYYYRGSGKPSSCTNGTNYMTGTCQNGVLRVEGTGAMLIEEFCSGAGLGWYSGCRVTSCDGYGGWYGIEGTVSMLNINASGVCVECSTLSMPPSSFTTSSSTFSGTMGTSVTYSYYAENSNCTGAACCRASISPYSFTVTRSGDEATLSVQTSGYCYYQP